MQKVLTERTRFVIQDRDAVIKCPFVARCRHGIVIRKRLLVDDEYPVYIPVVSIVRRSYNRMQRML